MMIRSIRNLLMYLFLYPETGILQKQKNKYTDLNTLLNSHVDSWRVGTQTERGAFQRLDWYYGCGREI